MASTEPGDQRRRWSRQVGRLGALVLGFIGLLAVAAPGVVQAQGIEESAPADGAVLGGPPEAISITLDTDIESVDPLIVVCNQNALTVPAPLLSADERTVSVTLESDLPAGTCVATYTVTIDGEVVSGDITFSILESSVTTPGVTVPPATPTATTTAATDDGDDGGSTSISVAAPSSGASWLGRLLSTLGLATLFGAFVLIVAAWPEGPEYVVAVRFLRVAWIVAMVGTVLYVIAYAAAARGTSFGGGVSPGAWLDLTDAGWPGRAALGRLVLTALTGWVVLRPERVIDPTTQLPAVVLPTLAVATIGLSRTGGDLAILGVVAGMGHALAMAAWFGAVVLLARVVLAGAGDEDLVHAVRGFGRISGPAIAITIATGFVQLFRLDGGALFTTGHGRMLLLKTLAVALMLFVGMTARQVAQHRLVRAADLSAPTAFQLRRAFGTEAAIGTLVLALSAGLLSFTPDKATVVEATDWAIEQPIDHPASGLQLVVRLEPGRVGTNRLQVEVLAPETGVSGLTVTFVPPTGSVADSMAQPIALTGAGIADTASGDERWGLPFDVAGAWTLQVAATTSEGAVSGATSTFEIRNADGSIPESDIEPSPTGAPVTAPTSTSAPAATTTTP